jgi:hypothetical protein
MNFAELSAPFPVDAIHWRAQNVTEKNGGSALALAYIDARDVMDRLDDVVGPACWTDTYEETPKGRLICRLSLCIDGTWIMKSDGAGDTDVEGDKGAISDSLKRAAVKWGIGRYLYSIGNVWAPCELVTVNGEVVKKNGKPSWRKWKPEAAQVFAKALASVGKPTGPIADTTRDWLMAQLQSAQMPPADLLNHFKPADLRDLTFEQMPEAKRFIDEAKKRKAA